MAASNVYDIGDVVRISATLTQDDVAVDPGGLSVVIRRPDGVKIRKVYGTDVEVERTAAGAYRIDFTPTLAGPHWYRWTSTGTAAAAGEDRFVVNPANALE